MISYSEEVSKFWLILVKWTSTLLNVYIHYGKY